MRSERPTVPSTDLLTEAEQAELLAQAASAELRKDMRCTASTDRDRNISFDDYLAFATSVARLANHPRRPFRPPTDGGFKL